MHESDITRERDGGDQSLPLPGIRHTDYEKGKAIGYLRLTRFLRSISWSLDRVFLLKDLTRALERTTVPGLPGLLLSFTSILEPRSFGP